MNTSQPQRGRRRKSSLAFPVQPTTQRGGFINFMENSGTAEIFLDLFSKLFNEKEKPEDPIRWLHNYLRQKAPPRQMELDTIIEILQQDIMQTAKEIEEVKELIHAEKTGDTFRSYETLLEDHFDVNDPEEPWRMKPDPMHRPIISLSTTPYIIGPNETEEIGLLHRSSHKVTSTTTMSNSNLQNNNNEDEIDKDLEQFVSKSTETSPQISAQSIRKSVSEKKNEIDEATQTQQFKFKVNDPNYFNRCIPDEFWTEDFSLTKGEEESEDEDEEEEESRGLKGKNYKFNILEETSWLPERDAVNLNLLRKNSNEDFSSKVSVLSLINTHVPEPKGKHLSLAHYEWIQKNYGPLYLKENHTKGHPHKRNTFKYPSHEGGVKILL